MCIAEFIVIMGFSFVNPFMPLYIRELGGLDSHDAALWTGIAMGGAGFAMFLSAPVWGIIADRWGRKPMVLRAMFGGAIVLSLAGIAPNVGVLVVLRSIQGLLTGTVAAASALVATVTPRGRVRFAMGVLMVSIYSGNTMGPLLGGMVADRVGFKPAFFITGAMLLAGALLVLFFVKENFERPAARASFRSVWSLSLSTAVFPLLVLTSIINMSQQAVNPIISLYLNELNPGGAAATTAGGAFALMGLLTVASSFVAGRMGGRTNLKKMLFLSCVGMGLLYLPPIWAATAAQLVVFFGLTGLFWGSTITSQTALLGLSVPASQLGIVYGLSQSASSLGAGLGPVIGGSLAGPLGLRYVFALSAGLSLLAGALVTRLASGRAVRES